MLLTNTLQKLKIDLKITHVLLLRMSRWSIGVITYKGKGGSVSIHATGFGTCEAKAGQHAVGRSIGTKDRSSETKHESHW